MAWPWPSRTRERAAATVERHGDPDRAAELLGRVDEPGGDSGVAFGDADQGADRYRDEHPGDAAGQEQGAGEVRPEVPVGRDLGRPQDPGPDQGHPGRHDQLGRRAGDEHLGRPGQRDPGHDVASQARPVFIAEYPSTCCMYRVPMKM